jgi:hypothetical protein
MSVPQPGQYCFEQLHIDVARNTTDDFNPFHDPRRWQRVRGNPFGSTIVLGFQTEFLVSDLVERQRRQAGEDRVVQSAGLHFSNFEFRFAGALRPGERFSVEVRKTIDKTASDGGLSNRVMVRKQNHEPVLIGTQSETQRPRCSAQIDLSALPPLDQVADRAVIGERRYFLKRKHLTVSNGKNFVLAGLGTQQDYFDELDEFVQFPPVFTAALMSCGLLEKAWREGYDFEADPVVYTSHQISVDRRLQSALCSNDRIHLLVEGPLEVANGGGLGGRADGQQRYQVFGIVDGPAVLFRAGVQMAALRSMPGASV